MAPSCLANLRNHNQLKSLNLFSGQALRQIFEESDSWSRYCDEYQNEIKSKSWVLFFIFLISTFAFFFLPLRPYLASFIIPIAGAAGASVSIMSKMPLLEVKDSSHLASLTPRILARLAAGIAASITGCALLSSNAINIQIGKIVTYATTIQIFTENTKTDFDLVNTLIMITFPFILGFSERMLGTIERRFMS